MAKKEFIDTKLIARITSEVLLKVTVKNGLTIQNIADKLPHSYPYVRSRLNGEKGNYELYELISIAIGKDKEWYRQLNIDICEYILNHDKETFIEKFGTKRFNNSEMKSFI